MSHDLALRLAHHHPGRLRVRADALCAEDSSAAERLARVRAALDAIDGVHTVVPNPRSGSVRVDYEPGAVDPNALIDAIARAADLEPPAAETELPARRLGSAAIDLARDLNALTFELTGGRADLRELVPMAMTGVAAYSLLVTKHRLPRWDNLAYWAFSIFQTLHRSEIASAPDRAP